MEEREMRSINEYVFISFD